MIRALLCVAVWGSTLFAAPAAFSARALSRSALWAENAIVRVSVSPSGDWVVAVARHDDTWGLLLQRVGEGYSLPIFASKSVILDVSWIGNDMLLATHPSSESVKRVVFRLWIENEAIMFESREIRSFGAIVSPLADDDGFVLWGKRGRKEREVDRISITSLTFGPRNPPGWPSGARTTVASARESVDRWVADRDGVVRAVLVYAGISGDRPTIRYRKSQDASWRDVWKGERIDEDRVWLQDQYRLVGLTRDQKQLLVLARVGHDTIGLHVLDPETGKIVREVFRNPSTDAIDVQFDYNGVDPVAVVYGDQGAPALHYFEGYQQEFASILEHFEFEGSVVITSASRDHRTLAILEFGARHPGTFYFATMDDVKGEWKLTRIGDVNDRVRPDQLVPVEAFQVESEDGLSIEAFVAVPERSDGRPPPLVVYPHGGPILVRDDRFFDPMIQYLANAGLAVLQVNYRGSSGYGLKFQEAGAGEWGRGIEDDIDLALRHVLESGRVDRDRLCIIGGSYGGYSALMSAIRWPERYRCVVTINGVTDVAHDMTATQRNAFAKRFYTWLIGDVDEDFDEMVEISPVYGVERIAAPVMIVQGLEDVNVDPEQAFRLRAMLAAHGKPFEWLKVSEMGHSPNRIEWQVIARGVRWFLRCHLGEMPADRGTRWNRRLCRPGEQSVPAPRAYGSD